MPPPLQGSDAIGEYLERGLVAVIDGGGQICGGGVLVDDRHVVTCAHVVNSACSRNRGEAVAPDTAVTVRFPYAGGGTFQAAVAAWRAPTEPGGDAAVLELAAAVPEGAAPARLVTAAHLTDHPFKVWGFPYKNRGEMLAEGVLSRRRSDGLVQLRATEGNPVQPGYSGAPVWDDALQGVVGIVARYNDRDPASRTAYLLPVDKLAAVWPQLDVAVEVDNEDPDAEVVRVVGDRVSAAVVTWRDRETIRRDLRHHVVARDKRIVCVTGRR